MFPLFVSNKKKELISNYRYLIEYCSSTCEETANRVMDRIIHKAVEYDIPRDYIIGALNNSGSQPFFAFCGVVSLAEIMALEEDEHYYRNGGNIFNKLCKEKFGETHQRWINYFVIILRQTAFTDNHSREYLKIIGLRDSRCVALVEDKLLNNEISKILYTRGGKLLLRAKANRTVAP